MRVAGKAPASLLSPGRGRSQGGTYWASVVALSIFRCVARVRYCAFFGLFEQLLATAATDSKTNSFVRVDFFLESGAS